MLAASYPTKKALKEALGQRLKYVETGMFGAEYRPDGCLTVVGPSPTVRKWYAQVEMAEGKIVKVS